MIKICAFVGVKGSGKDFRLEQEKSNHPNSETKCYDFSDGVREFTFDFLGYKPENYEQFKTQEFDIAGVKRTGRNFLDSIGMKMRYIDENFWANYTIEQAKKDFLSAELNISNFLFGSCRFENEASAIINFSKRLNRFSINHSGVDLRFIFCDFKSDKYDDSPEPYQELALNAKKAGFKDGDDITDWIKNVLIYSKLDEK